jgi:spore maturation protein CgeB
VEECIEQVEWLMRHGRKRREIAEVGQRRTLRDYSSSKRAGKLDSIIREELGRVSRAASG